MVHYSRAGASALPFVRFAAAIALVFPGGLTLQAQEAIPRLENGRPDLNGVWQVLNAANYDIEPHAARKLERLSRAPLRGRDGCEWCWA
jgi:hypothetical protein